MIKSKSLSEKRFNQITNHLVEENKRIKNKDNGKRNKNSFLKDEKKNSEFEKRKKNGKKINIRK